MNLLDADQKIPALVTTYRFRIRFHFETYQPSARGPRYDNAIFAFFQTEEWQTEYDGASVHSLVAGHLLTPRFILELFD